MNSKIFPGLYTLSSCLQKMGLQNSVSEATFWLEIFSFYGSKPEPQAMKFPSKGLLVLKDIIFQLQASPVPYTALKVYCLSFCDRLGQLWHSTCEGKLVRVEI